MLRLFNFTLQRVYIAFFLGNILLVTACYGGTNDNDYESWFKRGNALYDLGRYEEAIASYDKALEFKPDYYEAWGNRGIVLINLGRHEDAIASCDKALKLKPDDYVAWNCRGTALLNLGRYEEAIASFDAAIRKALTFGSDGLVDLRVASSNRSDALKELGRYKATIAIANYDKALELKPDDHEIWYKRGTELAGLGRHEEALASFNKALKFKPGFYDAWYSRGFALSHLGRKEESRDSFDKAREFKPKPQEKSALEQLIEQREDSCISPRGWGDLDIMRFYYSGCCSSSAANRHPACERAETIFRNVQELGNMGSPKK